MATGGGYPKGQSPLVAPGTLPRPWPFFDPRGEQADDLSNARLAQIGPAGGRINPAQVSLAVKLRQCIEERGRRRVSRERRTDIVGKITALRTFRGQLDSHLITDRDPHADQALRGQRQHPSAAGRHEPGANPAAADRAADRMIGLSTPRLIWVEWHRDDRAVPGTGGDDGAETLRTHDPIVA